MQRNPPSKLALQKITESSHVPAVSYAYVETKTESKNEFASTSLTVGKKNAKSTDADLNQVDDKTQFPASSLSKIVFTYLVLQLAKKNKIDLDQPLHHILQYKRFLVNGKYPEKATQLTARHVLSHTTGLPNLGPDLSSTLSFDSKSELGKGYSYSGEAFLYLQKVIEARMGKDLETLAREYVFAPLGMNRSTFLPQSEGDTNVVAVHTETGSPAPIFVGDPPANAAGSLLTTAHDFSKFMVAWLKNMKDPLIRQAFKPTSPDNFPTCGLGWHIYRNNNDVIAYQYGENINTRSFIAINVKNGKGAAFFTNSENGMSIASQLFNSQDFHPIGDLKKVFQHLHYVQNDALGWSDTIAGKIAEDHGEIDVARDYFNKALFSSPENKSYQLRLEWFNAAHPSTQEMAPPGSLTSFEGAYTNRYNDTVEILIKNNALVHKQFGQETKLVRVSETEFFPEKDQSFKITFNNNQMHKFDIQGHEKTLSKKPSLKSQENSQLTGSTAMVAKKMNIKLATSRSTNNSDLPANSKPSENPVNPEVSVSQRKVDYENNLKEIDSQTKPRFNN